MYSRCNVNMTPCKCDPIILPVREKICNRYHTVEQPIICPVNTRIVHHYVPRPVYYPTYSTTEESQCCGGTSPATPGYTQPLGMNNNMGPNGMTMGQNSAFGPGPTFR